MIDKDSIDRLARNIEQHAFRRGYVSAFTLSAFPAGHKEELTLHITRECEGLVYGNAEAGSPDAVKACVEALDGRVDYIVRDINLNIDFENFAPKKSILLPYNDQIVWVESVRYMLLALILGIDQRNIVCVWRNTGSDKFLEHLSAAISAFCKSFVVCDVGPQSEKDNPDALHKADIIIGSNIYTPVITDKILRQCVSKPVVIDAGIGTLTPEASEFARSEGLKIIRVDNRAAMAGMLFSLIQSYDLVTRVMGEGEIDGIPVVAGGIIGAPGTIVVDSIDNPSTVIGFADGTGRIRYEPANDGESDRINRIRRIIEIEGADG